VDENGEKLRLVVTPAAPAAHAPKAPPVPEPA